MNLPASCKGTGSGIVETSGADVEMGAGASRRSKAGSRSRSMSPRPANRENPAENGTVKSTYAW